MQVGDAITVVNKGTGDHGLTSTSIDTGTLHPGESTLVFLTDQPAGSTRTTATTPIDGSTSRSSPKGS